MRSAIAQVNGVSEPVVVFEQSLVRFKLDEGARTNLQQLKKAIEHAGADQPRFGADLLLQLKDPGAHEPLRNALIKLKGVTDVGMPDERRVVAVKLDTREVTHLKDVIAAAAEAGVEVSNPGSD